MVHPNPEGSRKEEGEEKGERRRKRTGEGKTGRGKGKGGEEKGGERGKGDEREGEKTREQR